MITNEEQEMKELWSQAKRAARAMDGAIKAKNQEAIDIHKAALLRILDRIDEIVKDKTEEIENEEQ